MAHRGHEALQTEHLFTGATANWLATTSLVVVLDSEDGDTGERVC